LGAFEEGWEQGCGNVFAEGLEIFHEFSKAFVEELDAFGEGSVGLGEDFGDAGGFGGLEVFLDFLVEVFFAAEVVVDLGGVDAGGLGDAG
jgi:hypothetical protein